MWRRRVASASSVITAGIMSGLGARSRPYLLLNHRKSGHHSRSWMALNFSQPWKQTFQMEIWFFSIRWIYDFFLQGKINRDFCRYPTRVPTGMQSIALNISSFFGHHASCRIFWRYIVKYTTYIFSMLIDCFYLRFHWSRLRHTPPEMLLISHQDNFYHIARLSWKLNGVLGPAPKSWVLKQRWSPHQRKARCRWAGTAWCCPPCPTWWRGWGCPRQCTTGPSTAGERKIKRALISEVI